MTVRVWDKPWSSLTSETETCGENIILQWEELLIMPAEAVHTEFMSAESNWWLVMVIYIGPGEQAGDLHLRFHTLNENVLLSDMCKCDSA